MESFLRYFWFKIEDLLFKAAEETVSSLTEQLRQVDQLRSDFEKCFAEKEETRNEKMLLENECSDLKEKLELLLRDFGNLKAEMQNKESNDKNATQELIEVGSSRLGLILGGLKD